MPRTRARTATKPATRTAPKSPPRIVAKRPSNASSLQFLSQDSEREDTPALTPKRRGKAVLGKHKSSDPPQFQIRRNYISNPLPGREDDLEQDHGSEPDSVAVKQELADIDDADTETEKKQENGKKRGQDAASTRALAPKRRKPWPPLPTPTTRRNKLSPSSKAKNNPVLTPRPSIDSTISLQPTNAPPPTTVVGMTLIPYIDLLRPYMAFQLSLSGLSGNACEAAQASMTEVIDVVDRLKQFPNAAPITGEALGQKTFLNRKDGNGVVLVKKGKEEESIVARKLRKLEDDVGLDSVRCHRLLPLSFPRIADTGLGNTRRHRLF
jgi:hypothetical protein